MMRKVAVFGATGSIGASTLDVIARHPEAMRASVLVAGTRVEELLALCRVHAPDHAVIANSHHYEQLRDGLRAAGLATEAHAGDAAIDALAASDACNTVVAAIVGAAGLSSTLAAASAGKRLLLANKESLVLAGELLMREAEASGSVIVPIDSEHNAVFQCLGDGKASPTRITLTASGGPFRGWTRDALAKVFPAQAVAHPKWSMGPKISVDSATLMNKGLEVIEAHHLFRLPGERIRVLVHPQSLVHAMVDFADGSTLAQLGLPDMRTALAVGLGWPQRIASGVSALDLLSQGGKLEFEAPDHDAFPCLRLATSALDAGGTAPAVLNAANEVAVSAFLQGKIGFLDIPDTVSASLDALPAQPADTLESLLDADRMAREAARQRIATRSRA